MKVKIEKVRGGIRVEVTPDGNAAQQPVAVVLDNAMAAVLARMLEMAAKSTAFQFEADL